MQRTKTMKSFRRQFTMQTANKQITDAIRYAQTLQQLFQNIPMHHHVNYEHFTKIKLKDNVVLPEGHNNYEMVLDADFHMQD